MRIQVKDAGAIAAKWQSRSQGATQAYQDGVNDPNVDWAATTAAAQESYRDGVQAAITRDAFKNGVTRAGSDRWRQGTIKKGVGRWAPGINQSKDAMIAGITPVLEALSRVDLPPRRPKRDPQNMQRVEAVVRALGAMKLAQQKGAA